MLKTSGQPKNMSPLGPFPRYIWIHPDAPPDDLDRVCYGIWKRAQSLLDGLKPPNTTLEGVKAKTFTTKRRVKRVTNEKDDITRLVEEEYMNLILENLPKSFGLMSIHENLERGDLKAKSQAQETESCINSQLVKTKCASKILPTAVKKSLSQGRFSAKPKDMSSREVRGIIEYPKAAESMLSAQDPMKPQCENPVKAKETLRDTTKKDFDFKPQSKTFGPRLDMTTTQTSSINNKRLLPAMVKPCSREHSPKECKCPPPGFSLGPNASNYFPGMIRSPPPGFMYFYPASSMRANAMNNTCFPPMYPNRHFIGPQHVQWLCTATPGFFVPVPQQRGYNGRQTQPVNHHQVFNHFTCLPRFQQMNYFQYVPHNSPCQQRTVPKPRANPTRL